MAKKVVIRQYLRREYDKDGYCYYLPDHREEVVESDAVEQKSERKSALSRIRWDRVKSVGLTLFYAAMVAWLLISVYQTVDNVYLEEYRVTEVYTVKYGDCMYSVAKKFSSEDDKTDDVAYRICFDNDIHYVDRKPVLYPGQKLVIRHN